MDIFQKSIIDDSITHLEALLDSGVLISENWGKPIFRSTFLDVIVTLRNLLGQLDDCKLRVDFKDDIVLSEKIGDISDLVVFIRNAFCHPKSPENVYKQGDTVKLVYFFNISNEKDGDICFYFGTHQIFLKRHIVRAFEEAKKKVKYEKRKSPQEILDSLKENKDE